EEIQSFSVSELGAFQGDPLRVTVKSENAVRTSSTFFHVVPFFKRNLGGNFSRRRGGSNSDEVEVVRNCESVRGQNFAVGTKADGFLRAAVFKFDVEGSFVAFDEPADAMTLPLAASFLIWSCTGWGVPVSFTSSSQNIQFILAPIPLWDATDFKR